jgi:hypothetical protein
MISNDDILFASLMGSKYVKLIERSGIIQNELAKRVLPPIPFLPLKNDNNITITTPNNYYTQNNWKAKNNTPENAQFFPLSFSFSSNSQKWLFPFEPLVNVSGGNDIKKVNVARVNDTKISNENNGKRLAEINSGTIKTRTNQKDFNITITGVLIGDNLKGTVEDCYPIKQMNSLFEFLMHNKEIYLNHPHLEILGIHKIVIEDFSFPFTKCENVQAYEIKALSDYNYNLEIKEAF